jgi:dephospho-CoA kinase
MQKVGITGGIGSGKSTVCRIFKSLGIPIYDADQRAKWLMAHDNFLIENIKLLFGEAAYFNDGSLNRTHISSIAFKNSSKLSSLNALVHPAVALDGENWFNSLENVPYGIKEAALLVESGSYLQLDKLIVVTAPLEVRIQRVMLRDKVERAAVEARIAKQMTEAEKVALADFVVVNDGETMLIPQVLKIHKLLINHEF